MKKILTLFVSMMAISVPLIASGSDNKSKSKPIIMNSHPIRANPNPTVHRAPMRVCVDAYYDAFSETISISYDGEATGEVLLYKDGELIDNSSEINTTFQIYDSGFYSIEINTQYWSAEGSIEI